MKRTTALAAAAIIAAATPAMAANPDISIVGDFQYQSDFKTQSSDLDRFGVNEIELAVQGYLSPWSRADLYLSRAADEDGKIGVEEGFLTLLALPGDLHARIGKFKMPFGKINPVHPEGWISVDAPLVNRNLLSEEGWNNPGLELSGFVPNPFDHLLTLAVGASNGENEAFNRGAMANARVTTYLPFNDEAGLEVGISGASQFQEPVDGSGRSSLVGGDWRFRWRQDPSTSFTLLGEYMQLIRSSEAPSGEYVSADYQWQTAHNLALRLDRSFYRSEDTSGGPEPAMAVSLTYGFTIWETTRFKVQGTHTFAPVPEDRLLLQTLFVLGPHKHALNF